MAGLRTTESGAAALVLPLSAPAGRGGGGQSVAAAGLLRADGAESPAVSLPSGCLALLRRSCSRKALTQYDPAARTVRQ